MKGLRIVRILKFAAIGISAAAVAGFVVMSPWNWVIPPVVGWHAISFVQAITLLVPCRLLFGTLRRRGGQWRRGMHRHWANLTPEERERLRDNLRHRCVLHRTEELHT